MARRTVRVLTPNNFAASETERRIMFCEIIKGCGYNFVYSSVAKHEYGVNELGGDDFLLLYKNPFHCIFFSPLVGENG